MRRTTRDTSCSRTMGRGSALFASLVALIGCNDGFWPWEDKPIVVDTYSIGCCADEGTAQPDSFYCSDPNGTAGATVFFRVDLRQKQTTCAEYTLTYGF